jgi:hypothetical protein
MEQMLFLFSYKFGCDSNEWKQGLGGGGRRVRCMLAMFVSCTFYNEEERRSSKISWI